MTAYYGMREIQASELTKLRADGQFSRIYLSIPVMATVCSGTVSTKPTSNNSVVEVAWTISSGDKADVLAGMTCLVGTSANSSDKGVVRIRKTPTDTALYIGECSEIDWAAGDHITVINDFSIWRKDLLISDAEVIYMDYDIVYSDQHKYPDPIVIMGSDIVVWLTGAAVTVNLGPSTDSYIVDGSTIASVLWEAPGASATTGLNTNTPTATYNAAGVYRVSCSVTSTAGKTNTGYRYVHVYSNTSLPLTEFKIETIRGDFNNGGWSADISVYADTALLRDRSRVVIFARDFYQGVEGSIGQQAGRENVILQGWIVGKSISYDPKYNRMKFSVVGPAGWIRFITGFPSGLEDTNFSDNGGGDPTKWVTMNDLTVAKALWHFMHWRSTIDICTDVFLPVDDTRQMGLTEAGATNLWDQITILSTQVNLRFPVCDRYGRLYIVKQVNYVAVANRPTTFTTVMTLTRVDYSAMSLTKRVIPDTHYAEVSGVYYLNGVATSVGAKSPGDNPRYMGNGELVIGNVIMDTQENAIILAGLALGAGASDPEGGTISLNANNRMFDIIPSLVKTTTAEKDTTLGIVYTDIYLIPISVMHMISANGFISTELEVDGVGIQMTAIPMTFPGEGDEPVEPPSVPPSPPPTPGGGGTPPSTGANAVVLTNSDIESTTNLTAASPTWDSEIV